MSNKQSSSPPSQELDFIERTHSNIGKRGRFYFMSTLSLFLYMIIPCVLMCCFVGFLALNFKTEQDRIDYLQHFGHGAFNLTSSYSAKVIGMMNSDKLAAEQSSEFVQEKLRSFFTFTELQYAFIVTCMIGLVIYMRVVVMTRLIIFTWLRRLIFGAIPDDFMLVDFLTLKKERTFENVKVLIDQLFEITKINITDMDTIIIDTPDANDKVFGELKVYLGGAKKDVKLISLCGMNISAFKLIKDSLPNKSRALVVTNNGNKDTTVVLVSNNPKDARISKYIYVKSETLNDASVSQEWKNSKYTHLCLNTTDEKLDKELEESVLEPTLKSVNQFKSSTTSFNALEFIDNKRKGKRNDLILQMNCGTNSSTSIVWKII